MKIAVFIEGGIVQTVLHDGPGDQDVEVIVVDWDAAEDGADDDELTSITFSDGTVMKGFTSTDDGLSDPEFVDQLFRTHWDNHSNVRVKAAD
jgi:hypothetical protein